MGVACVARIPVWFRSKERLKNDKERDFRSLPSEKWNGKWNLIGCSETARKRLARIEKKEKKVAGPTEI